MCNRFRVRSSAKLIPWLAFIYKWIPAIYHVTLERLCHRVAIILAPGHTPIRLNMSVLVTTHILLRRLVKYRKSSPRNQSFNTFCYSLDWFIEFHLKACGALKPSPSQRPIIYYYDVNQNNISDCLFVVIISNRKEKSD